MISFPIQKTNLRCRSEKERTRLSMSSGGSKEKSKRSRKSTGTSLSRDLKTGWRLSLSSDARWSLRSCTRVEAQLQKSTQPSVCSKGKKISRFVHYQFRRIRIHSIAGWALKLKNSPLTLEITYWTWYKLCMVARLRRLSSRKKFRKRYHPFPAKALKSSHSWRITAFAIYLMWTQLITKRSNQGRW